MSQDIFQNYKIYNEDCLSFLSKMPSKSIKATITSPPYNMNLRIRNGKYCSRQITKEFSTKYFGFDDNLPIDEYYDFHLKVLKELIRVSDLVFYNIQIVTGSKRAIFKLIGELNEYLKDIIIWDKGHAQPAMQFGVLNRQSELILIFEESNAISRQFSNSQFERGTLNDVWVIPSDKKRNKTDNCYHGAKFPEQLVEKIITNFTKENDWIFDPFAGTGTTGVVAKKMYRNFLGCELIDNYANLAQNNIDKIII